MLQMFIYIKVKWTTCIWIRRYGRCVLKKLYICFVPTFCMNQPMVNPLSANHAGLRCVRAIELKAGHLSTSLYSLLQRGTAPRSGGHWSHKWIPRHYFTKCHQESFNLDQMAAETLEVNGIYCFHSMGYIFDSHDPPPQRIYIYIYIEITSWHQLNSEYARPADGSYLILFPSVSDL